MANLNCRCDICGTWFHRKPCKIHEHNACSKDCLKILMSKLTSGKNNPNYGNTSSKSARWKSDIEYRHGYRFIRNLNHPFADSRGFVREHRLVAEQCLLNKDNSVTINGKIYLSPDYVVHHLDFDKLNNNPNNLFICENSFHSKFHNYIKKFRKNNPNTELSKEELIQMFFTYKDIAA